MTNIEIELGVPDQPDHSQPFFSFDPGVEITINGDHALAVEVMEHLEKFASPAGQIEVK